MDTKHYHNRETQHYQHSEGNECWLLVKVCSASGFALDRPRTGMLSPGLSWQAFHVRPVL
jgi:hypothetical protein